MTENKCVALYLRVSTSLQHNGLEAQQRALEAYCVQSGIANFKIYSDEGISGAKSSRPSLDLLTSDVKAGLVSTVVVYSFSRFARSTKHLIEALEFFDKYAVGFVSLSERLETNTPSGRAIFTILAAISQLERELVSERVKNGLVNARAKGKRIGAPKIHKQLELFRHLRHQGHSVRKIAAMIGCSPATVCRELKKAVA